MARGKRLGRPLDLQVDLVTIQQLQSSRAFRDSTGLFWAEGLKQFFAARLARRPPHTVVVCNELLNNAVAKGDLRRAEQILEVTPEQFLSITRLPEPQGIGIVAEQRWDPLIQIDPAPKDLWIVLDNTRTAGNLGTILRTNTAAGGQGVMLVGGEADPHEPAAVRASMGGIFHQRLVRTSAKALEGWRKRHPCRIVGASPRAKTYYRDANYQGPLLLVLGNERSGIGPRQLALCDQLVTLPMTNLVDSLNLAVATGILLYEAVHQRQLQAAVQR